MSSFVNLVTLFIFTILVISLSSPQFPLPPQVSEKALIPLDLNEEELKKLAGQTVRKGDREYIILVQVTSTPPHLHTPTPVHLYTCIPRAPERWERWECVPSQFEILTATFG